ncbi:hypothetical protein SAMN05444422_112107 [Halobiforma haloterrestris]|uniref:Uncharacterized protein n=1 Tax=Natronobacterium haloterrestre TaxID=148448 RepID=A0A1I1KR46_NATHA|nr:hypothetical protein [Halobiforma haloterrestris]SFC63269.1 hypothetical protein SAMN05444422_112107 [Halobiforma haloterrestris]
MTEREEHENEERTVKCPVEGCDEEVLARGIHLHVRQSADDGHGPQGEVPDGVTFDGLETVGSQSVRMKYPTERDSEEVARLCPYCSEVFTGKEGVRIHLGQTAGRKNHPPNANELHEPEDFPQVTVDAHGNVEGVLSKWADDGEDLPTGPRLPATRVYRYIAQLLAEDKYQEAQRARQMLLGNSEYE